MKILQLISTEKDQLNVLLYHASRSENVRKSRRNSQLIFGTIMLLLSLLFAVFERRMGIMFFTLSTIAFIFFPVYLGWYYKRNFTKLIKSNEYRAQVGIQYNITFEQQSVLVQSPQGETRYLCDNFDYISETRDSFYIRLKTGALLIFPKNQIIKIRELKNYFKTICSAYRINFIDDNRWYWK
ncbi:YcxB family protein [Sphingobacterium siyangense]|uniref:YcxB family protein n=2 Tax=Sphingobacterium TaxID=28453 RepID=UPI003DA2D4E3